jgi:hypothetical protein
MIKKVINCNPAVVAIVLLTSFPVYSSSLGQNRDQRVSQKSIKKQAVSKEAEDERARKKQERIKQALNIVETVLIDTKNINNPVVRIKTRILAADAYWDSQPEKAREIISEEFPKIAKITIPESSEFGNVWSIKGNGKTPMYKGVPLDEVKAQLRREMLAIVSARDSALARALVEVDKKNEKNDEAVTEKIDEVLASAAGLADTDPEAAARIIKESLKTGVTDGLAFLLMRLRDSSPAEASAIFNQMFSEARTRGDLWEFQQLVPYVLPTELDRLVGGKHYLTDSQRMKDANSLIEYAAELLYRRIQTVPPSNMSPELVSREYFIWRNLLAVFNDLKPESVWLVNMRLRQLTAVRPPSASGPTDGPWSEERLKTLIAAAKSSFGDTRDQYLDSAASNAWRFGAGDLDQALLLAESIENKDLRASKTGMLYFQAGLKFLRTEGPDYALGLARKIDWAVYRTRLYLAVIATLNSVKATERSEMLREELLDWLRVSDRTSDTAWALLDYLDGSKNDNAERNFEAFEILVRTLNGANLDPPDNKPAHRTYWYPDMHNFRKSLAPLANADFDRGLEIIQTLKQREVAMQILVAFSAEYLKLHQKDKNSSSTAVLKSDQ